MTKQTILGVAWDARQATQEGEAGIRRRQQERLQAIVDYARLYSPFYADHYRDVPRSIDDVTQLPPVTKRALMVDYERWVTDPSVTRSAVEAFQADPDNIGTMYQDKYLAWTTSGTSGDPAIVLQDANWFAVAGGLSLARVIPVWLSIDAMGDLMRGGRRMMAIFATGHHYMGVTMAERQRQSSPLRRNAIVVMSALTPLPLIVDQLNEYQPVMVSSYASMLAVLAREQEAGRLDIEPVMVSSSGETLDEAMRETIEGAFGTRAWNAYSTSETGVMAQECVEGKLHLNADWFIVEPVDEHGEPVPPGTPSHKIYVTNLVSSVQPVLRYEMGDSLTFDPQPCACGSPLPVIQVVGRTDAILELSAPSGRTVSILPMAIATVVEEVPGVRRYQIAQTGEAELAVRLETLPGADRDAIWQELEPQLARWLAERGVGDVTLRLAEEGPQAHPGSGKLQHVLVEWSDEKDG